MDQFVCVRIVQANGMDLSRFQFDFDLTFAVVFMNHDGTIYGRFGTRSGRGHADHDITLAGLAETLSSVLSIHAEYPQNRDALAGKQPTRAKYSVPEQYPALRKFPAKLDPVHGGHSCIHCHMILDAQRKDYRDRREAIPDELLFSWPLPQDVGLELDSRSRARVQRVRNHSPAQAAGFELGDQILALEDQPIVSAADVQWVLHRTAAPARLSARVRRGDKELDLVVSLPESWRRRGDISWRTSTWDLRRMALGGLVLEEAPDSERDRVGLDKDSLGLRVKHVGQYGEHAAAKRAGVQKNDLVVSFDGQSRRMTESELLAYALKHCHPGEKVPIVVVRHGERVDLELPMQ
jgi:hypothetical protein